MLRYGRRTAAARPLPPGRNAPREHRNRRRRRHRRARAPGWRLDTDNGSMAPRSALDVLVDLNERVTTGNLAEYQPVPLGFTPLDKTIGTGLRAGELLLIGGAQGTGKTTMALQMARNIASGGQANVLYICFEHDEAYLMNRLIAMESALAHLPAQDRRDQDPGRPQGDPGHVDGRGRRPRRSSPTTRACARRSTASPATARTCSCCAARRPPARSTTCASSSSSTASCRATGAWSSSSTTCRRCPRSRSPRTSRRRSPSSSTASRTSPCPRTCRWSRSSRPTRKASRPSRLRNFHLRGSSAINYEADIILILNEKYHIVAKVNIEFNPYQAQRFRDWVIVSVEKNRGGQDNVDLEFEKHFEFSCFDPNGRTVQEKLIEERLYND